MKKDGRKATGELIKRLRKSKGLSQMRLAELLDVSYQQIQKYEKGVSSISIDRLKQIAKALDVPVSLFFPSGKEMVSEPLEAYGRITDEEQHLLHLFRGVRDKKIRNAVLSFLKSLSK